MVIKGKFKKALPARTGQGRNGFYDFRPYVVEFEQESERGASTNALLLEFSAAKVKVDELDKIVGTEKTLEIHIGFDVEGPGPDGRYFNRIYAHIRDAEFRIERQY